MYRNLHFGDIQNPINFQVIQVCNSRIAQYSWMY